MAIDQKKTQFTLETSINDNYSYISVLSKRPIFNLLKITNLSKEEDTTNLKIKIYFEKTKFVTFKEINIPLIKKKEIILLDDIDQEIDIELLSTLRKEVNDNLIIEMTSNNQVVLNELLQFSFLPVRDFTLNDNGIESIASFIVPNSIFVKSLVLKAKKEYKGLKNIDDFKIYKNDDNLGLSEEVRTIYNAIQNLKLSEVDLLFSSLLNKKCVRLLSDIYREKIASIFDLTCLFLSCLEYIGMNGIFTILNDSIYVSYWNKEEHFSSYIVDNYALFKNLIEEGRISLLDCDLLFKKVSFIENQRLTTQHFKETLTKMLTQDKSPIYLKNNIVDKLDETYDFLSLDIKKLRIEGYYPLNLKELNEYNSRYSDLHKDSSLMDDIDVEVNERKEDLLLHQNKFDLWEKKLLDLTKSNKLINMRLSGNNIHLINKELKEVSYIFSLDENDIEIISKERLNPSDFENEVKSNLVNKRLVLDLNEKEFYQTVPQLYKSVRKEMEESGSNILFLSFGLFKWRERKRSRRVYYAPVFLLPIDITKRGNKEYLLKPFNQEGFLNEAFLSFIKDEMNININISLSDIPKLDDKLETIDINSLLFTLKKELSSFSEIEILEEIYLGKFSFSKYILWNNLIKRKEDILKNDIVSSLLNSRKEWKSPLTIDAESLDYDVSLKDLALPLPFDSSQEKAIIDASLGESFIMIGPPGTGKSQTITNMIVNSIYQGKKVLFCSEKKAALDVVYKRLKEVKMDVFSLELYSHKQDKREVLSYLERVLNLGEIEKNKNFERIVEEEERIKKELKDVVFKLHDRGRYPFSLYDCILEISKYKDVEKEINIPISHLMTLKNSTLEELKNIFLKASSYQKDFKKYNENPFRIYQNRDFSLELKDELKKKLLLINEKLNNFNFIARKLNQSLDIEYFDDETLTSLANILSFVSSKKVYFDLLMKNDGKETLVKLREMINFEVDTNRREERIKSEYDSKVFDLDISSLFLEYNQTLEKNKLVKYFKTKSIIKRLRKLSFKKSRINNENLEEELTKIKRLEEDKKKVLKNSYIIQTLIPNDYLLQLSIDYPKISLKLDDSISLLELVDKFSFGKLKSQQLVTYIYNLINEKVSNEMILTYISTHNEIKALLIDLEKNYKFDFSSIEQRNFYENLNIELKAIYKNIDLINEWSQFLQLKDRIEALSYQELWNLYQEGEDFETIQNIFFKSLYSELISFFIKDKRLESFVGKNYELLKDELRKIDEQYKLIVINEVFSKVTHDLLKVYSSNSKMSEVGILKQAIKSQGRNITLRSLMSLVPKTIQQLAPCILVSPLSCNKYLDPDIYKFDLIIFDEASQIPTSDVLNIISMGRNVVISGDDKQLPPTSFFDKQINDENDDISLSSLDSILDDCIASSFPQNKLLYHYRSKDESLIAFSNNAFYDNSLYTFPSLYKDKSNVKFRFVNDGIYDIGRTSTNINEAKALINEVIYRLKNNENNQSFGIITFSIHQMDLIEKLLDDEISKDKELYQKVNELKEPLFVKNLENVQGDERDVIYLSICYGRNKNGKLIHNFGPINISGGYRRLNVAISRSREEMVVFSSIKYSDINLGRTNSLGVKTLKEFLEYSERGTLNQSVKANNCNLLKGLEEDLKEELEKRGIKSLTQFGKSNLKIDLALLDENEEYFKLGVIFDSLSYALTPTINDKDIIRMRELEKIGWNIVFIWSLDYLNSKDKIVDQIVKKYNEQESFKPVDKEFKINFDELTFKKVEKKKDTKLKPYSTFTLKRLYNEKMLLDKRNRVSIYKLLKNIIDVESPISNRMIEVRMSELFSLNRKRKETSETIKYFISKLNNFYSYSYKEDIKFFYKDGISSIDEIDFFRKANGRDLLDYPKEEIGVCILELLESSLILEKEKLKRRVIKVLGFKSKTRKIEEVLEYVLSYLEETNKIRIKDNDFIELVK